MKLYSNMFLLLLAITTAAACLAQDVDTSAVVLDLSNVTIEDITEDNAREYYVRAMALAEHDSRELPSSVFIHVLRYVGGYRAPLVAASTGVYILEMDTVSDLWLEGAWESSIQVLMSVQRPFDDRERFYIISALDTQNKVLALKFGSEAAIDQSLTIGPLKSEILRSTGYKFQLEFNLAAICFVKSDFGGDVENILVSERFVQCTSGDE